MEPKVEINPNASKAHDVGAITADHNIPKFYVNGFQPQLTLSDANIVLIQNNAPVAIFITTLSGIKSLRNSLDMLVKKYEEEVGDPILSYEEMLAKAQAKSKSKNAKS